MNIINHVNKEMKAELTMLAETPFNAFGNVGDKPCTVFVGRDESKRDDSVMSFIEAVMESGWRGGIIVDLESKYVDMIQNTEVDLTSSGNEGIFDPFFIAKVNGDKTIPMDFFNAMRPKTSKANGQEVDKFNADYMNDNPDPSVIEYYQNVVDYANLTKASKNMKEYASNLTKLKDADVDGLFFGTPTEKTRELLFNILTPVEGITVFTMRNINSREESGLYYDSLVKILAGKTITNIAFMKAQNDPLEDDYNFIVIKDSVGHPLKVDAGLEAKILNTKNTAKYSTVIVTSNRKLVPNDWSLLNAKFVFARTFANKIVASTYAVLTGVRNAGFGDRVFTVSDLKFSANKANNYDQRYKSTSAGNTFMLETAILKEMADNR